jgi:hypothetical protein
MSSPAPAARSRLQQLWNSIPTNKELAVPQTVTNVPELMTHAQWLKGTGLTLRPRSNLLKELDQEILNYERNPTVFRLASVKEKLKAWQDSKGLNGAWKQDSRNDNGTVSLLDQQVRGLGDTDTAMGTQAFMEPGLINARLGVLYLFSHTYVDDSIFKVVLEGGIDVTTASLGAAGGSGAERAQCWKRPRRQPGWWRRRSNARSCRSRPGG